MNYLLGAVWCLAACGEVPAMPDVDGGGDAAADDANTTACTASTVTCTGDMYVECSAAGEVVHSMQNGGTETLVPKNGGTISNEPGGGGGGSVGPVRFNTTAGVINPQNGASIRSRHSSGVLATRLVP